MVTFSDGRPSRQVISEQALNNEEDSVCAHTDFSGSREGANAKALGQAQPGVQDRKQARVVTPGTQGTGKGL